ncbi:hypothetical protein [Stenotrophomonas rhizophila]|uniref:hypothetical protein n=1 Tax=Stenotrophomonas rhizophila TaxID=216778 RepID=UPI001E535AEB|nr:hypothetical protein [Stenotrophomonas rhizophila]MCC7635364.1 hypothetical protein [Stenotrophomonas rhizophila]MCC7664407.1 hypothetical protein [Stenotrophomonas rhizophila]
MNDQRTASAIHSIWWQVALGGFLALTAHSLVEAAYLKYQVGQVTRRFEAEMEPLYSSKYAPEPARQQSPPAPLRDNQRCMQGRRFERVENGWKQINTPC